MSEGQPHPKRANVEFIIGWLDALSRNDRDALGASLDPGMVSRGLREDLVCRGPEQVIECFVTQRNRYAEVEAIELLGGTHHSPTGTRRLRPQG